MPLLNSYEVYRAYKCVLVKIKPYQLAIISFCAHAPTEALGEGSETWPALLMLKS